MRINVPAPLVWTAVGVLWFGGIAAGLAALMAYDNRPGLAASAPLTWPTESRLARDVTGPTIVMMAHPKCDCTRASLTELAELMARAPRRPTAFVVFIKPEGVEPDWDQTGSWRVASAIPGVTVIRDDAGTEARRFAVQTSGEVLVYDRAGQLRYSGGSTGARGKVGENAGRAAILAAVNGTLTQRTSFPVFGCALFSTTEDLAPAVHAHDSSR
jgi:hypothetical protein